MLGKITTGYQITIPASFRKMIHLKIGDYIDIEQKNNKLVITPVAINKKEEALAKFNNIFKDEITDQKFAGLSEDKVMEIVNKEIKESRKDEDCN